MIVNQQTLTLQKMPLNHSDNIYWILGGRKKEGINRLKAI